MRRVDFVNENTVARTRYCYRGNGNGRYFVRYEEYFTFGGWMSYAPEEEITKANYFRALAENVRQA